MERSEAIAEWVWICDHCVLALWVGVLDCVGWTCV